MKKLISILLSFSLLLATGASAFAAEPQIADAPDAAEAAETETAKTETPGAEETAQAAPEKPTQPAPFSSEEVLYGVLDSYGKTEGIYSVVIVDSGKENRVDYYGPFADVKNLSDTRAVELNNGCVSFDAPEGRFYFQSTLSDNKLPWDISIEYTLNGAPIKAEELGGQSGRLGIKISVKSGGLADSSFYDGYLMQVTVTLDSRLCTNITAADATVANSSANKLINFSVMPGADTELSLTADVVNFSMPGITLSGVPFSMGGSLGDVEELTDGLTTLTDAISQLSDGANQLSDGAIQFLYGAHQFGDGLYQLSENSAQLVSASSMFLTAFNTIRDRLQGPIGSGDVQNIEGLVAALGALRDSLNGLATSLTGTADSIRSTCDYMAAAVSGVTASAADIGNVTATVDALEEQSPGVREALNNAGLGRVLQTAQCAIELKANLNTLSDQMKTTAGELDSLAEELNTNVGYIDFAILLLNQMAGTDDGEQLNEIIAMLNDLSNGYKQFHDGLVQYTGGVDALADNWAKLYEGMFELTGGSYQLSDGTSQLNDGTKDIPDKVDDMLSGFTGGDYSAHSFLSDKNTSTTSVQFVLTTDAITLPAAPVQAESAADDESTFRQFWGRFVDLFT